MNIPALRHGFADELRQLADRHSYFSIALGLPKNGMTLSAADITRICENVLVPLCASSGDIYIYGQEDTSAFRLFAHNTERIGRKHRIIKGKELVRGYESFWGAYWNGRGTILFVCDMTQERFGEIARLGADPTIITNLGSIASPSAIRQARKLVDIVPSNLVFLLSANQGLNDLHIFANRARLHSVFDAALKSCTYSSRFLGLYGANAK